MQELGHISEFYEVGHRKTIISNNSNDPGGKSYGHYQLASKNGMVAAYVAQSRFKDQFAGTTVPNRDNQDTPSFDAVWRRISRDYSEDFRLEQKAFLIKENYGPVRRYANKLFLPFSAAMNELLFSMAIQHGPGNTKRILKQCRLTLKDEQRQIKIIYEARRKFAIEALPSNLHLSMINRYINEEKDILRLIK